MVILVYRPIQIPCPFVKKRKNEEIKDDKRKEKTDFDKG